MAADTLSARWTAIAISSWRPVGLPVAGRWGADPRSPLASPIHADLSGLAPLLIQVGASETLLDDALTLAKAAEAADVYVDLQIWPEMVHVWRLFHPELKAGGRAIDSGGAFVWERRAG